MIHALIGLKLFFCQLTVLWCTVSAEVIKPYKNNFFAILQVVKAITAPLFSLSSNCSKSKLHFDFFVNF
tara:strand:- start:20340 stop:20546 length:207 start_codon:yes stop_codon:yes gene_type:complete